METATAPSSGVGDLRNDPITFEVLRNAFKSICNEASALIERVSYAPTITEGHDYSVSILTPDGRLVSHGQRDQAPHMGTFEASVQNLIREVTEFAPGDAFIYNDPYTGGTHQNDVKIIRPIFWSGELFAFAIALCHWPDVGGPMHGTFNPRATECYAEGLRMPPLKLYENDEPVKPIWDLVSMNIRVPKERVAEMHAQHRAGVLVEERLLGYVEKFGEDVMRDGFEDTMDHSERRFREWVSRLPDGEYEFEDWGDRDLGKEDEPPIRVHCKMTIDGNQVTVDWTGCDPAPVASWGFARPALQSATYDGTMHCFPELAPLNHGVVRAINIVSKPGTCVDVQEPTPVTGYCSGAYEKVDAVTMACWGQALQDVDPRRIHAATVNLQNFCTGGIHPKTGAGFVSYMWLEGGQGARAYADGNSFYMMIFIGGASNQPNETLERWYPMVYTSTEAVVDSCGDGEYRGGFGIWRSFRATGDTELVVLGDRERVGPFGLAGGTNGGPNMVILNPGTDQEENLGMFTTKAKLKKGDQLEFGSNGGGGFGLPWERKVESVLDDVMDELLSLEKARETYGVAITEVDADALVYEVDEQETQRLRGELAEDGRPRGTGPFEVNELGEKLFRDPGELDTRGGTPAAAATKGHG
ncbi:MAG: methylhydantoinase [Solirubrobacterales bacterium]|jgi:N-methylhydantoinase B|nr:methylhydantoinase [Solirubrobacterales bacterium]